MSEEPRPKAEDLARQAQQHLASLKAAGVEWLPTAPLRAQPPAATPEPIRVNTPAVPPPVDVPPAQPLASLFGEMEVAAPALVLPLDQRRHELQVLANRVRTCTRCVELVSTRTQTVFGVGAINPELCFVGEAPGEQEDLKGEPFVGPAGQLLDRIIAACGMKREEVYICNILRCRPPGNRTPLPDEAGNCREYLERQLELVSPRFICCLGACAAQNLLGITLSIGRLRGKFQQYRGIPVLCTYHPSYLLRNPAAKKDVWEDMKLLMDHMGRVIPGRK